MRSKSHDPRICDGKHIDKGQLSRYLSNIHLAFIYIICKKRSVMILVHICTA